MQDIPRSEIISTKQQRIAAFASQAPGMAFTSLNHYIDIDWLHEAYRRTRKDGAVGVDGQTAEVYAANLEANLQDLLNRAKSGRYRAPAVRRVYIPKGDGFKTRPIGIPTFEDKILQRAVVMVLEPIYEQDFLDCSYGFRPGRSQHQALQTLRNQLMSYGGGWIIEVDIQAFYDTLDKAHLREFLQQRVRDGALLRLIGKWMNAGVLEQGSISYPEAGTPQGGVVSPILSNVYLHEVVDVWFAKDVKPRLKGQTFMLRWADDMVIGFTDEGDARRVMNVLPKRFGKYGLTLHPDKTRLIDFRRPPTPPDQPGPSSGPGPRTFDLLGFTHHWAKSRKGNWVIKQKTAKDRFSRAVRRLAAWCRQHRHWSIHEQHEALAKKLRGHCAYYGITGNSRKLQEFRNELLRRWHQWLNRRSQRNDWPWERFQRFLDRNPFPPATPIHSTYRQVANP